MYSNTQTFTFLVFSVLSVTCTNVKDTGSDRGAHSDRGGLWFGPRLGKRSLRLNAEDDRQTFFKLLEAADTLKYYYDQLPYYDNQANEPTKVTKKVIFTPKLGRSLYDEQMFENVEFTPRLGRRLADDMPATPPDQEMFQEGARWEHRTPTMPPPL